MFYAAVNAGSLLSIFISPILREDLSCLGSFIIPNDTENKNSPIQIIRDLFLFFIMFLDLSIGAIFVLNL